MLLVSLAELDRVGEAEKHGPHRGTAVTAAPCTESVTCSRYAGKDGAQRSEAKWSVARWARTRYGHGRRPPVRHKGGTDEVSVGVPDARAGLC